MAVARSVVRPELVAVAGVAAYGIKPVRRVVGRRLRAVALASKQVRCRCQRRASRDKPRG